MKCYYNIRWLHPDGFLWPQINLFQRFNMPMLFALSSFICNDNPLRFVRSECANLNALVPMESTLFYCTLVIEVLIKIPLVSRVFHQFFRGKYFFVYLKLRVDVTHFILFIIKLKQILEVFYFLSPPFLLKKSNMFMVASKCN